MAISLKRGRDHRYRLFVILIALGMISFGFQAKPAHASISFVQATSTGVSESCCTLVTSTKAFGANTTAGDLIIVSVVSVQASVHPTGTISDTQGDTFVLATSTNSSNNTTTVYHYYAANIKGGADTVHFAWSSIPNFVDMSISEYSGLASTNSFDQSNNNTGSFPVTSVTTNSTTISQAKELLYSFILQAPGSVTTTVPGVSSGWTVRNVDQTDAGYSLDTADDIVSTVGTYSNTWSGLPSDYYAFAFILTFEASSSPPTIASFSASPPSIGSGASSTLSWNITNASSVAITPGSFSTSTLIASTTVSPTSTTIYTLTATNVNGTSTATTTVTVDNSTPTTPTSVVATPFSVSQINLTWASSTDSGGSGIAGYNIFRCTGSCTPSVRVATSSGASYSDTGLSASTTYTYAVQAYNGVGTVSATSTSVSTTTLATNTIDAASCNESDVQTAISAASSGYTVVIPSGTCTWASELSITTPITLMGTGTPNVGTSTFGAGTSTTEIIDNFVGTSNPMINVSGITTGQTFRLSLLDIEPEATSTQLDSPIEVSGTCTSSGCGQTRIDNITFGLNTPWVENNNGSAASWMTRTDDVIGVIDHNTVPANSQVLLGNDNFSAYLGVGQYGDNSWAQPDSFGGANALFYENNVWHTISNGGMSMIDMDISTGDVNTTIGGGRAVCRYNQIYIDAGGNGIGVCDLHGTEGTGRPRSGRQLEVYDNTINCTTPGYCTTIDGGPTRGGTGMLFDNHANLSDGSIWFALSEYRTSSDPPPWGSCNGAGPYDQNDGVVYVSSTLTSASGGGGNPIIVGDTSQSWTTNQWVPNGAPYGFYDVTQGFSLEIASNTSNSLTSVSEAQQTYTASVGDNYQILRSTICIDGIGRGAGTYLSGSTPLPTGWVNEPLDPIYQWGDTASGASIYSPGWSSDTGKLIANRDFYPQVSGQQTTPTSPFNGTSGTGWGTLADRPTTCTPNPDGGGAPGVGYFATDADNGNGILYTCNTMNVWTADYQPAPYPYALTAQGIPNDPTLTTTSTLGGSIAQFPMGTNFIAGTNVTLTANASSGYVFSGWSGSVSTSTNPLTVAVNSNLTLTANFSSTNVPPPISSFAASPSDIQPGVTSTLSWNITNASSAMINNLTSGIPLPTGSVFVYPTSTITYTITATNSNGTSTATTTIIVDGTPPSPPTSVIATVISSSEIDLSWASSTDNVGVAGYRIYEDNAFLASTTNLSYQNTGLSAGTQYSYYLSAFDAAGNVSATSTSVSATTQSAPSGGGGGGSSGGGGGGGGSFYPIPTPTTPASSSTIATAGMTVPQLEALLASLEAELTTLETEAGTTPYAFTRNLTLGSQGPDVKALQHYLNTHGFPVVSTPGYAGSLGYETEHFGMATQRALALFQKSVGITPDAGFFGPKTRAWVEGDE